MGAVGPVFVTIQGKPLRGFKDWFDPAAKEAGIKEFIWYLSSIHIRKPPSDDWGGLADACGTDGTRVEGVRSATSNLSD